MADEQKDWIICKAQSDLDIYSKKAWLLTAKTLYPRDFNIQFEDYEQEKISGNIKQAAVCLYEMFQTFPSEGKLIDEVQRVASALQTESVDSTTVCYRDLFGSLPVDIQCKLLLTVSNQTENILDQCRTMLLVIKRFPRMIPQQGLQLIDSLLSAEKHAHMHTPVNCYRKYFVHDVLPLIMKNDGIDVSSKTIYRWIQKSIEFYISYLTQPSVEPGDVPRTPDVISPTKKTAAYSSSKRMPSIQGLPDKEGYISKPWDCLFEIVQLTGDKLDWRIGDFFYKTSRELQWNEVVAMHEQSLKQDSNNIHKQTLYCATILLLDCLYHYICKMDSNHFTGSTGGHSQQLAIVELFNLAASATRESKAKKMRIAPNIVTCPGVSLSVVNNFTTAVKCWEMLSSDKLSKDFSKLKQHLHSDSWRWLKSFLVDFNIYQGNFTDGIYILNQVTNSMTVAKLREEVQMASCFYSCGQYSKCCDLALTVIIKLSNVKELPKGTNNTISSSTTKGRQLKILPCTQEDILPYCIQLLILCCKEKTLKSTSSADDLALGHMIVLSQYDWPWNDFLFLEAIDRIKAQGCFSYPVFFTYVTNIDILEEFAYMKSQDGGKLNLDILPPSTKILAQQRVTRGVNKGVKEDFKVTMEKQVARSEENIYELMRTFLSNEQESIKNSLL